MCSFRSLSSLSKPSRVSTSAYVLVLVLVWCNLFWEPLAQFVYSICCSLLFTLVEAGWAKKARSVEPRGKRKESNRTESSQEAITHEHTTQAVKNTVLLDGVLFLGNDVKWRVFGGCWLFRFSAATSALSRQRGRDAAEMIMARDVDYTGKSMWILRRKREPFRWVDDDSRNRLLIMRFLILYFIVHLSRF